MLGWTSDAVDPDDVGINWVTDSCPLESPDRSFELVEHAVSDNMASANSIIRPRLNIQPPQSRSMAERVRADRAFGRTHPLAADPIVVKVRDGAAADPARLRGHRGVLQQQAEHPRTVDPATAAREPNAYARRVGSTGRTVHRVVRWFSSTGPRPGVSPSPWAIGERCPLGGTRLGAVLGASLGWTTGFLCDAADDGVVSTLSQRRKLMPSVRIQTPPDTDVEGPSALPAALRSDHAARGRYRGSGRRRSRHVSVHSRRRPHVGCFARA